MRKFYTKEEDQFLIENYSDKGSKYCAEKLSRSRSSITQRCNNHLKLTSKIKGRGGLEWTKEELEVLVNSYPEIGAIACAELLKRTYNSVKLKANSMGLKSINVWTPKEDQVIINNYPTKGALGCMEHLPGRTRTAIVTRATNHLNIRCLVQINKMSHEDYEDRLFENEIDYFPLERYVDSNTPILHECLKGHTWNVAPKHILNNSGCPSCSRYGFDPTLPAILYYIRFTFEGKSYYKVGISKHSVYYRLSKDRDKNIEVLYSKVYQCGQDARDREKYILDKYKQFRITVPNLLKSSGNTELFNCNILELNAFE